MVKALVVYGLGIGCHEEVAHAFRLAGADAELVHLRSLLEDRKLLEDAQIINFSGGFLHGDMGGAGMYAANELDLSGIKDELLEFAQGGGLIYGQCNGFQLLVKTGLLPGIEGDYSSQTVTLTDNDCGNYRVDWVRHIFDREHPVFDVQEPLHMWCRHAEGKIQFGSEFGSISAEEAEANRRVVNEHHVLLRYADRTNTPTEVFPDNPNGSVDGIAGLVDTTGNILGHMGHLEVGVDQSRHPSFSRAYHGAQRMGLYLIMEGQARTILRNMVKYVGGK